MKILKVKKLTNEKWLNLFAADYQHNDHTGRWVFASRQAEPHKADNVFDAVIIVPILRSRGVRPRLVMLKEFRVPVGSYVYALPAGLLEKGEQVEETVRREMLEETGLEVTKFKTVTQGLYSTAGMTDEAVAVAFVDVRSPLRRRQQLDHSEDIEVVLLTHAEACALCGDRSVRIDAKAWMAPYLYQQLGKFV